MGILRKEEGKSSQRKRKSLQIPLSKWSETYKFSISYARQLEWGFKYWPFIVFMDSLRPSEGSILVLTHVTDWSRVEYYLRLTSNTPLFKQEQIENSHIGKFS